MNIKIKETKDTGVLARLSKDVQDLHAKLFPEIFKKYSKERMRKLFETIIKEDKTFNFVAYKHDVPVGYIIFNIKRYPDSHFRHSYDVIYIDQICITENHQNLGIGRKLLKKVVAFAKAKNIKILELDVWSENTHAKKFFTSQGFKNLIERMVLEV